MIVEIAHQEASVEDREGSNEAWTTPQLVSVRSLILILLRVFLNRIYENDRELCMVAHWFADADDPSKSLNCLG